MFSHHRFEFFDAFDGHVVFRVAEVHERARVSAVLRNHYFNWRIRIDNRRGAVFCNLTTQSLRREAG